MDREQALEQFLEEQREHIVQIRKEFMEELLLHIKELKQIVDKQFILLNQKIKEAEKEVVMFLYFSLLKIDVLHRKYTVILTAQDFRWYLDPETIELSFSIDFLFDPLNKLWDKLLLEQKKYVEKINSYDVRKIIFEELAIYNSSIALALRYAYRDIEEESFYQELPKMSYFCIRWGEYRDKTEIIIQIDREKKTEREWKKELAKTEKKSDQLVFSYWYEGAFSSYDISTKNLQFITFENCSLSECTFDEANLIGAKFLHTKLYKISFARCLLSDVDFSTCKLEQVNFQDADLTNAIFEEEAIPYLPLSPNQLQVIQIKRKEG